MVVDSLNIDAGPGSTVPAEPSSHERDREINAGLGNSGLDIQIPTVLYGNQYAVLVDTASTDKE